MAALLFLFGSLFFVLLTEPLTITLDTGRIGGATLSAQLVFFGVTLTADDTHKPARPGKTNRKRSGRKFPPDAVFRAIGRVLRGAEVAFPRSGPDDPMRRALLFGWMLSTFRVLDVRLSDREPETGVFRLKIRVFRLVAALLLLFVGSDPKKKG